jgi:hypothetical protein
MTHARSGANRSTEPAHPRKTGRGTALVVGLLLLGIAAACTGIWYQWEQTRKCLAVYGAAAAGRIASAPRVELLELADGDSPGRLREVARRDISGAKGLVHLRRGLVEDANFRWENAGEPPGERMPAQAWDWAIVFSDPGDPAGEETVVVIDFDAAGGHLAVVGRPGRIGLGRLERGLETWIKGL